jgi:hypothetical protein
MQRLVQAVRARKSVLVNPGLDIVDIVAQRMSAAVSHIKLVLPGSFNPLHEGHVGVLEKAAQVRNLPRSSIRDGVAVFEISMTNADKGAIDEAQLLERLEAFAEIKASVVVTAEHPTFVSKAQVSERDGEACARAAREVYAPSNEMAVKDSTWPGTASQLQLPPLLLVLLLRSDALLL